MDSDQMRQVAFTWNISVLVKKNRFIDSISFDSGFVLLEFTHVISSWCNYCQIQKCFNGISGGLGPGRLAGNEAVQMTCGMIDF